jgi:drug/metabolite transporter (DMT)-like permease
MTGAVVVVFALMPFMQSGLAAVRAASLQQNALAFGSALASTIGLTLMFRYLAAVSTEKAGGLVIIMVVAQVIATMVFSLLFAKALPSLRDVLGVALAIAAIFVLQK